MTGYGRGVVETPEFVLSVEIKSVNNKFLKIAGRVPEEMSFIQAELDELVRARVERGSVFFTVLLEPANPADLYSLDPQVLKKYLKQLRDAREELGIDDDEVPRAKDCLLLPGVIRCEEELRLGPEELSPVSRRAMETALGDLLSMREREGNFLLGELKSRCETLRGHLAKVRDAVPQALTGYQKRLEDRVNQLLANVDVKVSADELIREVAVVAERSDITEELDRMECHIRQFLTNIDANGAVGRKLEFIVQEMFRESNTMSAKALGPALGHSIVEIKAEVDRLKEQVQNLE